MISSHHLEHGLDPCPDLPHIAVRIVSLDLQEGQVVPRLYVLLQFVGFYVVGVARVQYHVDDCIGPEALDEHIGLGQAAGLFGDMQEQGSFRYRSARAWSRVV